MQEHRYTNHLIHESSPYLLQHAHNPVNWYPWGEEALELAKKEKKLIIVSIGYAACHWCHVMEKESFEDTTVANLMNKYYISIKVDREERPDVDQVYMDAAQVLTGRGGWPLNVIALPDGRPIFAGTYFTKQQWIKVLKGVQEFYEKNPEKALEQAMQVAAGVKRLNTITKVSEESQFDKKTLETAAHDWVKALDERLGGRRGNIKFPMPKSYRVLLEYAALNNDQKAQQAVLTTLDNMAAGGIYDHIGGGFARYSTDAYWHVPHFEKMLYDNAQLLALYSDAYRLTRQERYRQVVEETIAFCNRELRSPEKAYYSSLDADSEGEEGKYYVWSATEVDSLLGDKSAIFKAYYDIKANGNWEAGKNVLRVVASVDELANKFGLTREQVQQTIDEGKKLLFAAREQRVRPGLDDKILTSWNGLMLSGLAAAYQATGREAHRQSALALGDFIWQKMWDRKHLYRNYKNGRATISGFLDDYAFVIEGYIDLYQITFDETWLHRAAELMEVLNTRFWDEKNGLYRFKSRDDDPLYVDKAVIEDNVIPAGNSAMAINLFKLGHLLDNHAWLARSDSMLAIARGYMAQHAAFYYNWLQLYQYRVVAPFEVAIVGPEYDILRQQLAARYLPATMLLGGAEEGTLALLQGKYKPGKTYIYVCVNKTCQLPVQEVEAAWRQMIELRK